MNKVIYIVLDEFCIDCEITTNINVVTENHTVAVSHMKNSINKFKENLEKRNIEVELKKDTENESMYLYTPSNNDYYLCSRILKKEIENV